MTKDEFYKALSEAGLKTEITLDELKRANATLEGLNYEAFLKLCLFRKEINAPIFFMFNGLNSGSHQSKGHPEGKAFDLTVKGKSFYQVYKIAVKVGFFAFGLYYNGKIYSYHLEDSEEVRRWIKIKEKQGSPWIDVPFFIEDPKITWSKMFK